MHVMLPKRSAYGESYNRETEWMHFLIKADDLFKKYTIWGFGDIKY